MLRRELEDDAEEENKSLELKDRLEKLVTLIDL